MTLLDASVVIDALRAKDVPLLDRMKSAGGAICGVTRAEILSGARGPDDRMRLRTILDGFQQVAIPDAMWDAVGSMLAELRASGVTVPLADALLASVALSPDTEICARDTHFASIQKVIPALKLYRELS